MSDKLHMHCPSCSSKLAIASDWAGRKMRCPKCKSLLRVADDVSHLAVLEVAAQPGAQPASQPATQPGQPVASVPQPAGHVAAAHATGQPVAQPVSAVPPREAGTGGRGGKGGKAGLVLAVVFILVAAAIAASVIFRDDLPFLDDIPFLGGGKSVVNNNRRWLPDDAPLIVSVRVADIVDSAFYDAVKAALGSKADDLLDDMEENVGLLPRDFKLIVAGIDPDKERACGVAEMTRDVDGETINKKAKAREEKVDDHTVYNAKGDFAFCVIDDRTVVFGTPDEVKKVLRRNGDAKLSSKMESLMDRADFSQDVTLIVDAKRFDDVDNFVGDRRTARDIEAVLMTAAFGRDVAIESVTICDDAAAAEKLVEVTNDELDRTREQMKGQPELKPMLDLLDSVRVSRDGAEMEQSLTITVKPVKLLLERMRNVGF